RLPAIGKAIDGQRRGERGHPGIGVVASEHRLRGTGDGNAAGAADGAAKGSSAVDVERGSAQQHVARPGQAAHENAVVRKVDSRARIDSQRADANAALAATERPDGPRDECARGYDGAARVA